jgi:hypothetical protein
MNAREIAAIIVCIAAYVITSAMLVKTAIDLGAEMVKNAWMHKVLDLVSKTQHPYAKTPSEKKEDA